MNAELQGVCPSCKCPDSSHRTRRKYLRIDFCKKTNQNMYPVQPISCKFDMVQSHLTSLDPLKSLVRLYKKWMF